MTTVTPYFAVRGLHKYCALVKERALAGYGSCIANAGGTRRRGVLVLDDKAHTDLKTPADSVIAEILEDSPASGLKLFTTAITFGTSLHLPQIVKGLFFRII